MTYLSNRIFTNAACEVAGFPQISREEIEVNRGRYRGVTGTELAEIRRKEAEEEGYAAGHEAGFQAGFEEGLRRGTQQGHADLIAEQRQAVDLEIERFVTGLDQAGVDIDAAMRQWYADAEQKIASIASSTVARIFRAELQLGPQAVLALVKSAMEEVGVVQFARLRLNLPDHEAVQPFKDQILAAADNIERVEIVADASLDGGCVIETDGGIVDASTGTVIHLIEDAA